MYSDPTGHTEYSDPSGYGNYYSSQAEAKTRAEKQAQFNAGTNLFGMPTADYAKYKKANQQEYDSSHNEANYRPSWAYATITSVAKSTTQGNSTIPSAPTPCPTPTPSQSQSTYRSSQTTGTNPFADFWGKVRDIPSNIEYSFSSPNRFFSAALGASVRTVSTFALMPVAFVMDYTVLLPNTIQNIVRGEENCPIGTCESAVTQLTDNIEEWCVNECGGDRRAYEGGESNADVLTTTVGVYYGIKGICSLAESAAAWRNARGIAETIEGEANTPVIGRMQDMADIGEGEYRVADLLPDLGSPQANWNQNSGVLRSIMNQGNPIRDATQFDSILDPELGIVGTENTHTFLHMERNLLYEHGWRYCAGYWSLP